MSTASQQSNELLNRIGDVRRRLFSVGIVAALGWVVLAVIVVLLVAVWFDLLWELPPNVRLGSFVVAGVVGLLLFCGMVGSLWRKSNRRWLAHRLDEVGETGGEITSGLELSESLSSDKIRSCAAGSNSEIETGLATIAVDHAASKASQIDRALAIPSRPIKLVATVLAGVALLVAAIGFSMPKLAKTQWSRFVSPTEDVPPFSTIEFTVTPGDVEIRYGERVDVVAKLNSTPVDELQLVLKGSSDDAAKLEEVVPMFSEGDNQWRASLFRVTQPLKYQVRSGRARSEKFSVSLILVPEITDVQFRVTPPSYTRLGESVVPGSEGISGLPRTRVKVIAASNRPLSLGRMSLSHHDQTETIELVPNKNATGDSASEVIGEFEISHSGKFEIKLVDTDGIESSQTVSGSVTMLADTKPFVRMMKPKQNSWATATVRLPIAIDAEDDFGISNLSLFRSLNDTRPMPMQIEVPEGASRWNFRSFLPLSQYDLKPGDKLELFARVEDNDPQSIKGNESPVHVVHIISREQFEQLNQQQMGLESVLAKYRQIQRRLEALEAMQREIEAMDADPNKQDDPQGKPSEQKKQKMVDVAKAFKESAKEMQQMLKRKFPIDFDQELESRIDEMSDKMLEISREIRDLIDQINNGKIDNEELKKRLKELREELEGIREEFNNQIMQPLGELAKIFPLMSKQEAFVQLVLRQRNLAERLQSLDGEDDVKQPETKRRMRELADEQNGLRDRLDELLFEIENEAYTLPLGEEFNELRDSALKFAADVAESGAMDEQQQAEDGLAEFSGSLGFKHASKAADILEKFIDQSNDASQQAQNAANQIFNPQFGRPKLGNSMQQLMDLFGPRNGQRQGGSSNRGLYGDQPMSEREQRSGSGNDQNRAGGESGRAGSVEPRPEDEVNRSGGTTGSSQVTIPLRYERKVGDYYRRIVEELGDDN